ncbi:hypothetical protein BKI52_24430 [marine bacterium AO1-C]|nr:hypothetical protein BKI52_24430 [marine bacterium AO1-C]
MRNFQHFLFTLVCFVFATTLAVAQPKLPQPSPSAEIKQTVGLTDVTIVYSSPAVKGRKIWGGLQPYDSVWRAGANAPTKITFSNNVKINGVDVKKGDYIMLLYLHNDNKFEWILTTKGSQFNYKLAKKHEVVRLKAGIVKGLRNKERLTYYISANSNTEGVVSLRWEKREISFPFNVSTDKAAVASIKKFAGQANWFQLGNAGYQLLSYSSNDKDMKLAHSMIKASVAMSGENMINTWWHAAVLAKMGKKSEAKKLGKKVKEFYAKEKRAGWKNYYKTNIESKLDEGMKAWK